jgi:hypothetical protein
MIEDPILSEFLHQSYAEALALATQSQILTVFSLPGQPLPAQILCAFHGIPHLRKRLDGTIDVVPEGEVLVGIHFPPDYLRSTDRALYLKLISLLSPPTFFHPNVHAPALCPGAHLTPGMPLVALLWHIFDIVSYRNINLDELNALEPQACRYLRQHPEILAQLRPPPLRSPRFKVMPLANTPLLEATQHVDRAR